MLTALDRHFGWSGGESVAVLTVLVLFGWFAVSHTADAQACATELSRHVTIIIR